MVFAFTKKDLVIQKMSKVWITCVTFSCMPAGALPDAESQLTQAATSPAESVQVAVPRPLALSTPPEDFLRILATDSLFKGTFKGLTSIDPVALRAVTGLRDQNLQKYSPSRRTYWQLKNCPHLSQELQKFGAQLKKSHNPLQQQGAELVSQKPAGVSLEEFLFQVSRACFKNSAFSEPEATFFLHAAHKYLFDIGMHSDAWESASLFHTLRRAGQQEEREMEKKSFDCGALDPTTFFKKMPTQEDFCFVYPALGVGILGLGTLIWNLYNGVFLAGYSDNPSKVHGIPMSPWGLFIHDYIHMMVDPKHETLKKHICAQGNQHYQQGGDVGKFLDFYIPHALTMYTLHETFFRELFVHLAQKMPLFEGPQAFKKVMAGWFFVAHEYPAGHTYDSLDPRQWIEHAVAHTLDALSDPTIPESPDDPLVTSPLHGQTAATDKVIFSHMFKGKANKNFLSTGHIERGEQFIFGGVNQPGGNKIKFPYLTLRYKWDSLDDTLALLKSAGYSVGKKPDLRPYPASQQREIAQKFLKKTNGLLKELVQDFRDRAIAYGEQKDFYGISIADRTYKKALERQKLVDTGKVRLLKEAQIQCPAFYSTQQHFWLSEKKRKAERDRKAQERKRLAQARQAERDRKTQAQQAQQAQRQRLTKERKAERDLQARKRQAERDHKAAQDRKAKQGGL